MSVRTKPLSSAPHHRKNRNCEGRCCRPALCLRLLLRGCSCCWCHCRRAAWRCLRAAKQRKWARRAGSTDTCNEETPLPHPYHMHSRKMARQCLLLPPPRQLPRRVSPTAYARGAEKVTGGCGRSSATASKRCRVKAYALPPRRPHQRPCDLHVRLHIVGPPHRSCPAKAKGPAKATRRRRDFGAEAEKKGMYAERTVVAAAADAQQRLHSCEPRYPSLQRGCCPSPQCRCCCSWL